MHDIRYGSEVDPDNKRILIVEDHPDIGMLYQRLLSGYSIANVEDGDEARAVLSEENFDLVVLDMHLGKVSGMEVLQFMRNHPRHKETRTIVISADDSMRKHARFYNIDFWMTKPIQIDRLYRYLNILFVSGN